MVRPRPVTCELETLLPRLAESLGTADEVVLAFLFGSRARGEHGAHSDVDVAVYLREGARGEVLWRRQADITLQAAAILGTDDVDLVVLNSAPPELLHTVLREGKLLVNKSDDTLTALRVRSLNDYADRAWVRAIFWTHMKTRLEEGTFGCASPSGPEAALRAGNENSAPQGDADGDPGRVPE